jgi:hypothetical protein
MVQYEYVAAVIAGVIAILGKIGFDVRKKKREDGIITSVELKCEKRHQEIDFRLKEGDKKFVELTSSLLIFEGKVNKVAEDVSYIRGKIDNL